MEKEGPLGPEIGSEKKETVGAQMCGQPWLGAVAIMRRGQVGLDSNPTFPPHSLLE